MDFVKDSKGPTMAIALGLTSLFASDLPIVVLFARYLSRSSQDHQLCPPVAIFVITAVIMKVVNTTNAVVVHAHISLRSNESTIPRHTAVFRTKFFFGWWTVTVAALLVTALALFKQVNSPSGAATLAAIGLDADTFEGFFLAALVVYGLGLFIMLLWNCHGFVGSNSELNTTRRRAALARFPSLANWLPIDFAQLVLGDVPLLVLVLVFRHAVSVYEMQMASLPDGSSLINSTVTNATSFMNSTKLVTDIGWGPGFGAAMNSSSNHTGGNSTQTGGSSTGLTEVTSVSTAVLVLCSVRCAVVPLLTALLVWSGNSWSGQENYIDAREKLAKLLTVLSGLVHLAQLPALGWFFVHNVQASDDQGSVFEAAFVALLSLRAVLSAVAYMGWVRALSKCPYQSNEAGRGGSGAWATLAVLANLATCEIPLLALLWTQHVDSPCIESWILLVTTALSILAHVILGILSKICFGWLPRQLGRYIKRASRTRVPELDSEKSPQPLDVGVGVEALGQLEDLAAVTVTIR